MTVITHTQHRTRLTEMVDRPGGVSVGSALAKAAANLEIHKEQAREIIGDNINALLTPPPGGLPETMRLDLTYAASSQIIDAASPFAMDDLCKAAKGLCDLLDAAPRDGGFDWRIPTVHAQAMKLLLSLPPEEVTARTTILENLHQVLKHKLPSTTQTG